MPSSSSINVSGKRKAADSAAASVRHPGLDPGAISLLCEPSLFVPGYRYDVKIKRTK
jgi:hypothetical protein